MNTQSIKAERRSLSLSTIETAASGDVDAINQVLNHFEGYIIALSTKRLYDEDGTPYTVIDEALRRELELKLITKLVGFRFRTA